MVFCKADDWMLLFFSFSCRALSCSRLFLSVSAMSFMLFLICSFLLAFISPLVGSILRYCSASLMDWMSVWMSFRVESISFSSSVLLALSAFNSSFSLFSF